MVFTDGNPSSLQGIFDVLDDFEALSGLKINPAKSSIYMAGRITQSFQNEVQRLCIPADTLPVRYLGLPLTTISMTRDDYEPLIDKIRTRLLSWSSKSLSYEGRLQLINFVIMSITNFWCSVFKLPERCLEEIERMCSGFLWSGTPTSNTQAKVAWDDVCKPKSEGGLGIRRLADSSRVFALSLIWRLLTNSGSLWVAWTRANLLRRCCFWDVSDRYAGSWIWRKLLKLRGQAMAFLRSEIVNSNNTLFWFDNWLNMGRLLDVAGDSGRRTLGITRYATVANVASSGQWNLRRCRGYHLRAMIAPISSVPPPVEGAGSDRILWRHADDDYKTWFSSKRTWEQIRQWSNEVNWCALVWFPQAIPRFSFIVWLAFRNRLSTGDQTRLWGENQACRLFGEPNETRDHLFFACPYSYTIWTELTKAILPRPSPDWNFTVTTLLSPRRSAVDLCLLCLTFQTVIHGVWCERNNRKHNTTYRNASELIRTMDKTIRNRVSSLRFKNVAFYGSMMIRWLERSI